MVCGLWRLGFDVRARRVDKLDACPVFDDLESSSYGNPLVAGLERYSG